ncbi:RlpA-like double-psi beta-barrel-protein domain-containing protein-containing protein [Mortierella sp. GBAus27b]|nr:hypothetical protein BGX31_006867 [Mortierella sp. GBA43]KAI8346037.1 RlpA-like double-psi beta-barrel-protein domain-containing protein-containing protein [Mortierella sp. GBAus27b]
MKFAQLSILLLALVFMLVAEASSMQAVRFNKELTGKSTWFNGHDLKSVACYGDLEGNSHVNAQDDWHIGAVHVKSYHGGEKSVCFECAKITYKRRSVVVRVIDDCAACAPNQIDLTASAFKYLAPLSQGVIKTTYKFVRCPTSGIKWPKSPSVRSN